MRQILAMKACGVHVVVGMTLSTIKRRNHMHITKQCLIYQAAFAFFKGRLYLFLV